MAVTDIEARYIYRATVHRVIDGDTIILDVDLGFRITAAITVRLSGVDCPELSTPEGKLAKEFVKQVCFAHPDKIVVQSHKDARSFERWVGDVWVDHVHLGELLWANGHVKKETVGGAQ